MKLLKTIFLNLRESSIPNEKFLQNRFKEMSATVSLYEQCKKSSYKKPYIKDRKRYISYLNSSRII